MSPRDVPAVRRGCAARTSPISSAWRRKRSPATPPTACAPSTEPGRERRRQPRRRHRDAHPAIDLTVAVDRFVVGAVQRAAAAVFNCGGKGVNVAGCLADWGARVAATGVLGHSNDGAFADFFAGKAIADRFVRIGGETRTNIKIADRASGETTDVNLPGLTVSDSSSTRCGLR